MSGALLFWIVANIAAVVAIPLLARQHGGSSEVLRDRMVGAWLALNGLCGMIYCAPGLGSLDQSLLIIFGFMLVLSFIGIRRIFRAGEADRYK